MANRKNVHVVQRGDQWGTLREGGQRKGASARAPQTIGISGARLAAAINEGPAGDRRGACVDKRND